MLGIQSHIPSLSLARIEKADLSSPSLIDFLDLLVQRQGGAEDPSEAFGLCFVIIFCLWGPRVQHFQPVSQSQTIKQDILRMDWNKGKLYRHSSQQCVKTPDHMESSADVNREHVTLSWLGLLKSAVDLMRQA